MVVFNNLMNCWLVIIKTTAAPIIKTFPTMGEANIFVKEYQNGKN